MKMFPAREGLVNDIPAEGRKTANLFFTLYIHELQVVINLIGSDIVYCTTSEKLYLMLNLFLFRILN
jgi:hypothetical protein